MRLVPTPSTLVGGFAPGTMLGRYELLATIGTGGMASVILARQRGPMGFEKAVVLKVIHPHLAQDGAAIAMLLDEARVAAQINHHNVVQTYELGEAGGTFYIAMEYLAGESLAYLLKAAVSHGPLPTPELGARILIDVAEGLHAAHELRGFDGQRLGLIHRDVSPANIVVLYNGGVKVVDFGIAKAHGRVTSTQDGKLKGKYGYMAPEQIKSEPSDQRADVFSLGVVLWEVLALRRLFREENVAATLMQILSSPRVPPSRFRPEVPPALDRVALRALASDPAERFQSASEMKQALEDAIWQSRYGAAEIQHYMATLFADRIEERQKLLSRVAGLGPRLSQQDIAAISASFVKEDISSIQIPGADSIVNPGVVGDPAGDAAARRRTRVAMVLFASLAIAITAAIVTTAADPEPPPATPQEAASTLPQTQPASSPPPTTPAPSPALEPPPTNVGLPPVPEPPPVAVTPIEPEPVPVPEPDAPRTTKAAKVKHAEKPRVEKAKPDKPKPPPVAEVDPEPADPGEAVDLYKQGTDLFLAGDFHAAERKFKQAIKVRRGYAAAYRGLGYVYQRTGNKSKAIENLRRYLALAPNANDVGNVKKRIAEMGGEP